MAGIYIHIPFCSKACHYCDFHFSTNLDLKSEMVRMLANELTLRKDYIDKKVSTIYFGGGTPSLLSYTELSFLIEIARALFHVANDAEITLEANPDDLTPEKLNELKAAGVNRLSIGMQSFFEEDLIFMNRSHTVNQSRRCISYAREAGFRNISIDLIFALPGRDIEWLKRNVREAIALDVEHISCYGLTVEPRTVLAKRVKDGVVTPASDNDFTEQYSTLMSMLKEAGFEQYEISNFAKPGFISRHNSSYWKGESYLGIGPSAHSFNGNTRQWNIRNNHRYVDALHANKTYFETEELSLNDKINEYLLTSLRTIWGTDLHKLESLAGSAFQSIMKDASPHLQEGLLEIRENTLFLTEKGKFLCDSITSDLFVSDVRSDNT